MNKLLVRDDFIEYKLALLEDNILTELCVLRKKKEIQSGDILKGRVIEIKKNSNLAFIDIGYHTLAFLNIEKYNNINENDEILVQVEVPEHDNKNIRLSRDIKLVGENLIFFSNNKNINFSKKINDFKKINKIKKIFTEEKFGLIIRSSAENVEEENILNEYEILKTLWNNISEKSKKTKVGEIIYTENNLISKIINFNNDFKINEIIFEDKKIFYEVEKELKKINHINLLKKIKKYFKENDFFDFYGINFEIEKALNRKVELNSGGNIVIEKTESLISIDINTASNINNNFIVETNMEAIKEITRQIRLRNLSGIIIIDFVSMKSKKDRQKILNYLKENLIKDKLQTNIISFSSLDLIEMTRKRKGNELETFFIDKNYDKNITYHKSKEAISIELYRELKIILQDKHLKKIDIRAKREIIDFYIKNENFNISKQLNFIIDENIKEYEIFLYK